MTIWKRIRLTLVTGLLLFAAGEVGERFEIPGLHSAVPEAEAIIGRPLTPISYAGVARRTVRRCAVGVYYC